MNGAPLAYIYEAAHHCLACTTARLSRDLGRDVTAEMSGAQSNSDIYAWRDSESNELGVVAPWEEWYNVGEGNQTLACGDCAAVLAEYAEEARCPVCAGELVVDDSISSPVIYCATDPDHYRTGTETDHEYAQRLIREHRGSVAGENK